jgi:hypothetical protein
MAGDWSKLHNEGLHKLYAPTNIIRVSKSRRMRCAGLVGIMKEIRSAYKIWAKKI